MVNSNDGFSIMDEIIRSIAIEYDWADYISPPQEFVASNANIKEYVGSYVMDASTIQIDVNGDVLTLQYEDQEPILLKETTDGDYRNDTLNFKVTFKENELSINQNGQSYHYKRETTANKK